MTFSVHWSDCSHVTIARIECLIRHQCQKCDTAMSQLWQTLTVTFTRHSPTSEQRSSTWSQYPSLNWSQSRTASPAVFSSERDCCSCSTVWPTPVVPRSRTDRESCCRTDSSGRRYKTCPHSSPLSRHRNITTVITDHFSGPGGTISRLCVHVCVQTMVVSYVRINFGEKIVIINDFISLRMYRRTVAQTITF